MILAAGLGIRLRPHTLKTPKPLFPIGGKPLLAHVIDRVQAAGADEIVVNCHHLHDQIRQYLHSHAFEVPVHCLHEATILGTGGALKNAQHFWDEAPILIVNSDIWFDIDLAAAYRFHQAHSHAVTLVLTDDPRFNLVSTDGRARITAIHGAPAPGRWTFTGIHVIDPAILTHIPGGQFHAITDLYRQMIDRGEILKAFINREADWQDIGAPDSYQVCAQAMAAQTALRRQAMPCAKPPQIIPLSGDGSDRRWYRVQNAAGSLVMAACGIQSEDAYGEYDAFITIGRHLRERGLPVPAIVHAERFPGLVFLTDLGNTHLQDLVRAGEPIQDLYGPVVDLLVQMWSEGAVGFTDEMPFQTVAYDRDLILEKECAYFMQAFVRGYCRIDTDDTVLQQGFEYLAEQATAHALTGFMHRDFQSRNLMYHQGQFHLIDFQGARRGPLQYDLASLLIDPYVALPDALRQHLAEYCLARVKQRTEVDPARFWRGLAACGLTRNLQILGAFGFLTRVKQKTAFEAYIPTALETLARQLERYAAPQLAPLKGLVDRIRDCA